MNTKLFKELASLRFAVLVGNLPLCKGSLLVLGLFVVIRFISIGSSTAVVLCCSDWDNSAISLSDQYGANIVMAIPGMP
jgi:hypothetical protein